MTDKTKAVFIAILFSFDLTTGQAASVTLSIPSYKDTGEMGAIISGSVISPEGKGPFPAVILMHGCSGLDPAVRIGLQSHADFLVENGYIAIILDSFTGRGIPDGVCSSYNALEKARFYRMADASNALRYLQSLSYVDTDNIFLMGQSNGGSVALMLAGQFRNDVKFKAIVAFYPWCGALENRLQIPLLVLGGEYDDWTPLEACLSARNRITGRPYKVIEYENAHHSFDLYISVQSYSGHTIGGNEKAREDSRKQMLQWFEAFRN